MSREPLPEWRELLARWWREEDVLVVPIEQCGRYWRDNHEEECAATISRYAERLAGGELPPPVIAKHSVRDGVDHYSLSDGYHRLHGAHEAGATDIRVITVERAILGFLATIRRYDRLVARVEADPSSAAEAIAGAVEEAA